MLSILCWVVYGLVVGLLARALDWGGPHPVKLSSTIIIGIIGSYVGNFVGFLFGSGGPPFGRSGVIMGVLGALVFNWVYRNWHLNKYIKLEMKKTKELQAQLIEKIEKDLE